jgi:hypothetical protein
MSLHRWAKLLSKKIASARSRSLLIAAAVLHVALSILIALIGRFDLLPNLFDANGINAQLAFDSLLYRRKSIELVQALGEGRVADWYYDPLPFHIKLYSLSFAVFHPLFGFTMLAVEPLNLLYYLLIVTLVFKLGEEVFDRRTGLLAASIVALWPSFLLHTTQLLRDPLFIVGTLALVLVCTRWLTRNHSARSGLLEALVAGVASALMWLTRSKMWMVFIGFMLLVAALLVIRQVRERRGLAVNLASLIFLLALMFSIPRIDEMFWRPTTYVQEDALVEMQGTPAPSPCPDESAVRTTADIDRQSTLWSRWRARADQAVASLGESRRKFAQFYTDAGSNNDVCVRLNSMGDLVRYLPRAAAHGFFAPYPDMWFKPGSTVGLSGRLLSGAETLCMYFIELLSLFSLWRWRRRLPVWLMILIAALGMIALSLAIANVAVLFRLRYVFWMLLIVPGSGGALHLLSLYRARSFAREVRAKR